MSYREEQKELINDGTWKTSDGKLIEICDMTDHHIENVVNYIESQDDDLLYKEEWLELFREEQKARKKKILSMFD